MEHRWGTRIPVNVPVRISSASVSGSGTLRDMSVSGAYIETPLALDVAAWVRIDVPRTTRPAMQLDGIVTRNDGRGLGIEWQETCEDQPGLAIFSGFAAAESMAARL